MSIRVRCARLPRPEDRRRATSLLRQRRKMDCDPLAYAAAFANFEFVRNHPLTTPPGAKITRSRNVVNYKAQLDRECRSLTEPSVVVVGPIFVHPGHIRLPPRACTLEHTY